MNAFVVRESCDLKNYMIGLADDFHEKCPDFVLQGSYHILAARLLGFTYPEYLYYCAAHGGALKGRGSFPYVIFKEQNDASKICNCINKEWDKVYKIIVTED